MKRIISLIILVAVVLCVFVSCAKFGEDPLAYAEELEKKGFYVEVFDRTNYKGLLMIYEIAADFKLDSASMIDYIVFCENEDEGFFFYCANDGSAETLEQSLIKLRDNYRGYADSVIKREGKIVYFGAPDNWAGI